MRRIIFCLLKGDDQFASGAPTLALLVGLEHLVKRELERGGHGRRGVGPDEDVGRGG